MDLAPNSGGSLPDIDYIKRVFDRIKQVTEWGTEYWIARDLYRPLGYAEWENFAAAILRTKIACEQSGQPVDNHIRDATTMVAVGSNASRKATDYLLSRYACYLLAMNGDPRKPEIAAAQKYFAIQARRQELQDEARLKELEAERRIELREQVTTHNKVLADAALEAGVSRFGIFVDSGYKGLYDGLGARDLRRKRGLRPNDDLYDRMGATELAANFFRATQAEQRLRQDEVSGEEQACQVHYEVGCQVRQAIRDIGNPPPEELPVEPSIKALKRQREKQLGAGETEESNSG